ncbi:MAG: hypothetical protein Q8R95_05295, partial [Azonexus sp.]|nr:hypothetical protein [Azonexus sp.]
MNKPPKTPKISTSMPINKPPHHPVGRVSPQGVTRRWPDSDTDVGLRCANPTYAAELRKRWEHAGGTIPNEWEIVPLETLLQDKKSIAVGVMYPGPETPGGTPLIKVG